MGRAKSEAEENRSDDNDDDYDDGGDGDENNDDDEDDDDYDYSDDDEYREEDDADDNSSRIPVQRLRPSTTATASASALSELNSISRLEPIDFKQYSFARAPLGLAASSSSSSSSSSATTVAGAPMTVSTAARRRKRIPEDDDDDNSAVAEARRGGRGRGRGRGAGGGGGTDSANSSAPASASASAGGAEKDDSDDDVPLGTLFGPSLSSSSSSGYSAFERRPSLPVSAGVWSAAPSSSSVSLPRPLISLPGTGTAEAAWGALVSATEVIPMRASVFTVGRGSGMSLRLSDARKCGSVQFCLCSFVVFSWLVLFCWLIHSFFLSLSRLICITRQV
jgi:hypothetical protein